ncbi:MAG: hypothetical protein ABFD08_06015 [Syntrophomonas sp.]
MIFVIYTVFYEGVQTNYWHPRKPTDQEALTPITQFALEWGSITILAV